MLYLPSVMLGRRKRGAVVDLPPETPQPVPVDVTSFSTVTGDGVTSIDSTNKVLSIAYGTGTTSMRGSAPVTAGKRYRVSWTQDGATGGQAGFGTSLGGPQYRPTMGGLNAVNTFDFTAISDTLFMTFQRASAGTTTFSSITILEIPEVAWVDTNLMSIANWVPMEAGATVDAGTNSVIIACPGTLTRARYTLTTEVGKLYRYKFTLANNTAFVVIGTTPGSSQLKSASGSEPVGSKTFEFTAQTTETHFQIHRTASGTAIASDLIIQEVASSQGFNIHPFNYLSAWNKTIPSNATYAALTGFADLDIGIQSWAGVDDGYSIAFPVATVSDPIRDVLFLDSWVNVDNGTWARTGNDSTKEAAILAASATTFPFDMNPYSTTVATSGNDQTKPASNLYTPYVNPTTPPLKVRIPDSAVPASGADGHMVVIQPDGKFFEAYGVIRHSNGTILCTRCMLIDPAGLGGGEANGLTASMVPVFAGVMRNADIDKETDIVINHAIKIAVPGGKLSTGTPVYPALAFDRDAISNTVPYNGTGSVPMGSRLALPYSINLASQTFQSPLGAAIALAVQRHGFIITDRGDTGLTLFGEKSPTSSMLTEWHFGVWTDLNWIMDNVQRVTSTV